MKLNEQGLDLLLSVEPPFLRNLHYSKANFQSLRASFVVQRYYGLINFLQFLFFQFLLNLKIRRKTFLGARGNGWLFQLCCEVPIPLSLSWPLLLLPRSVLASFCIAQICAWDIWAPPQWTRAEILFRKLSPTSYEDGLVFFSSYCFDLAWRNSFKNSGKKVKGNPLKSRSFIPFILDRLFP